LASRIFRIYKEAPFHEGGLEEWSNVYRYSVSTAGADFPADRAAGVIDALLQLERPTHTTAVTFTRAESAEVTILDGIKATDLQVDFAADTRGTINPGSDASVPEQVYMVQERVGPKRWLRKFIHHYGLEIDVGTSGIAFNYDTSALVWDNAVEYASGLSPLTFTEPDGSTSEAIYEAGNGVASEGMFSADARIRWHDMKY
jgi:hypothetical protein